MRPEITTLKEFRTLIYELESSCINEEITLDECERLKMFAYDEYNRIIRRNNGGEDVK